MYRMCPFIATIQRAKPGPPPSRPAARRCAAAGGAAAPATRARPPGAAPRHRLVSLWLGCSMNATRRRPGGRSWPAPTATGPVRARLSVPGSKSMTNRALVLAALADGPGTITGPLHARDTLLMRAALTALGATITDKAPNDADPAGGPSWQVPRRAPTSAWTWATRARCCASRRRWRP